jgi:hypothetical protein
VSVEQLFSATLTVTSAQRGAMDNATLFQELGPGIIAWTNVDILDDKNVLFNFQIEFADLQINGVPVYKQRLALVK